ncbi:MAG: TMEM43 family protein [Mariniblastus sp.]
MAKKDKKNGVVGFLMGPTIIFMALTALWKNETRFDYYRAAARTTAVSSVDEASDNQLISHTGSMDRGLTIHGEYVKSFEGYLTVSRSAEIYAWDRKKDSDDHVTWSKRWMSNVERNSRNSGIRQRLSSGRFFPEYYEVGDLEVEVDQIAFVDSKREIAPADLELTGNGLTASFKTGSDYFYLSSGGSGQLGDERVSYRGIPVPSVATYFGKFADGRGTVYDDEKRTGFINSMIGDTGVLHYLVAGDRDVALASIKTDIVRLKWMVRAGGTAVVVLGFVFFFSSIVGFMFGIPGIGWLAEQGVFLFSVLIGIPLAVFTIVCAYVAGHPILLGLLIGCALAGIYWAWSKRGKARQTQEAVKHSLDRKYGHELQVDEIKELEFISLTNLAMGDAEMAKDEMDFLYDWGKKQGWDKVKCNELIGRASDRPANESEETSDSFLQSLIELALADGILSPFEMRTIRTAADRAGFDRETVNNLMDKVQETALEQEYKYQA